MALFADTATGDQCGGITEQRSAKAPVLEESWKRSSQSAFFDDNDGDRSRLLVMMTDMSGQRFVVSKYVTQQVGANLSILFRTMTTQESRRRLFPEAFSLGSDYEYSVQFLLHLWS